MKTGDLVRVRRVSTAHGSYEEKDLRIAMIIDGPNEVGKIKLLFSDGQVLWRHSAEVDYIPRGARYLNE